MSNTRSDAALQLNRLFARAPLYAILDSSVRPDQETTAILDSLLRAGVKMIQFRQKRVFGGKDVELCSRLAGTTQQAGGVFLVNDRADVAALCGADGVHLGQEDLSPEQARVLLGEQRIIGYSTHNRQQAAEASRSCADYLAIGPIFPTTTKKNPDPVVGLEIVSQVRQFTTKPLVAIGGITMENAAAVVAAGANAVAVISDLLLSSDIEERAKQFLAALRAR
jgi:thiamine-phosphate pyrophosphorylase